MPSVFQSRLDFHIKILHRFILTQQTIFATEDIMTRRKRNLSLPGVIGAIIALTAIMHLTALCVSAQEEQEKEEPGVYELAPMTVTAQKREENVQDVPLSVSVFSDIPIEDAGIKDMSELVRFTPNVFMKVSSAENDLIIRGISAFDTSIYSPAGFYVDGVNYPIHYMYNPELYDIERVEVLRGPQGTLYGRNTESGVVNIITKQPDDEFRAKLLSEYGSYKSWRFGADLSGPVAKDQLFLGLAMQYDLSNGYITNLYSNNNKSAKKDHKNGRATLRWTPTDIWELAFIADFLDTDDKQNSYRYRTGPFATPSCEIRHNVTDEYSRQQGNGQTLRIQYAGDVFDVISITGLQHYSHKYDTDMDCADDLGPWYNWGDAPMKYDIEHMSEELRVSSPEGGKPLEWLTGVYVFGEKTDIWSNRPAWHMENNTDIHNDGGALFGQGTYTFFERLHLTAGLRFDHQNLEGTMKGTGMAGPIDQNRDLNYNEWMPKFSVAYDFSDAFMSYATVSKGYMVGGYNYGYMPSSEDAFCYGPEYTWNYEAGIKTSWLNNRLLANLAFFYIDIQDKQVVEWSMDMETTIKNAAKAHSQGIELEVQARPLPGLNLVAGFGYVRSKFDEWNALQQDGTLYDFDGKSLPYSPDYTYNLSADYRHPTGFFARADLLGTGGFYGDVRNNLEQTAYEIVNLRFGYETDHWRVEVWGTNLSDEEYVTAMYDNSSMGLGDLVEDGEPRMVGITASYRF